MKKIIFLFPLLLATPVFAQDMNADRIDQIERQLLLLETKFERSGGSTSVDFGNDAGGGIGSAQTDIRISTMEEELRGLRGKLEEKDFENRRLADELEKFKRDAEFRLTELEKRGALPVAPESKPESKLPDAPLPPAEKKPEKKLSEQEIKEKLELSVTEKSTELPAAEDIESPKGFETPRDHYNYAFRLLNQNQYDEAARHFASFTKKYPKDALVGNAYYWLGETHYIRKDFTHAADQFRQGFEAMPKGPKAADNLLKLGMSLAALKKNEEACVIFTQVKNKFKAANAKVSAKADAEHQRIGCE